MSKVESALSLEPKMVARYLRHAGWKVDTFANNLTRIYFQENLNEEPIEIFFSAQTSEKVKNKEVFYALNTISDFYEKEIPIVRKEISSIAYDAVSSRVPDEYVSNDSIQFRVAYEYMSKMKDFLADTASTELSGGRFFKRTLKDAVAYAEKCRFGHTFRGSFGFLIESPVGLNDSPTLLDVEEHLPLGRRVVERIARGLHAYSEAVSEQSSSAIISQSNGFSSNMCDALADIIEEAEISKITIEINLSPEWRVTTGITQNMGFAVEAKNLELLREAAKYLRVEEKPRTVAIFGRIKKLETDGNPSDLLDDKATREIEVNWVNDDNKLLHVKLAVSPEDYLDAVEAHKSGSAVSATGTLIKSGRSWRLEALKAFKVFKL